MTSVLESKWSGPPPSGGTTSGACEKELQMLEITFVDLEERISAISEEDAMYQSGESIQLS